MILLHMFLAILIVKTDFIPRVKAKLGAAEIPNPHVINMVRYHQWMDSSVPDKATIFLGDSITQGLATAAVAPYAINYGIGTQNTAELLHALPSYPSLNRADVIFLAIGINDFIRDKKSGLSDRYREIVERLPDQTPLIWSSVMPTGYGNIASADIAMANETIRSLCANRVNCIFVDTWHFLADENGKMIASLFLEDGLHLSLGGYAAWIAALKQALQDRAHADEILDAN
jgi:lysophospholipase L1-like esterase